MNKRIKKKKSHLLLNPVVVAYIVAIKMNTQCPGFASDFKLTHRSLKRCLMYHYYIFKHNRKSLSHLYYTEQTLNKRYYSPELMFDAICRSHRRYKMVDPGEYIQEGVINGIKVLHKIGYDPKTKTFITDIPANGGAGSKIKCKLQIGGTVKLSNPFAIQPVKPAGPTFYGEREHPVGGESIMYTSTATVRFAPRIQDGRIISVDLCKEEN